ncbi:CAP domain-containing protein [Streptomyces sp. NPDC096205]|uniref:CAP domain-containing protein n=1 Tax=Streptomyces sp. NPDC096205 TaxID=3366081 RepID=UPI00380FE5AB
MGRHRRSAAGRAAKGRATGVTPTGNSVAGGRDPQHSYGHTPTAPGTAPYLNPEAYAEVYAKSNAYLFATDDPGSAAGAGAGGKDGHGDGTGFTPDDGSRRTGAPHSATAHRRRKRVTPVKTGLLGVSAAVALGAVAVATGVLPGGDTYRLGGSGSDKVQSAESPGNVETQQGGTSGAATEEEPSAPGTTGTTSSSGSRRSASPSASPSPSPSASTSASPSRSATPSKAPQREQTQQPRATPSQKPRATPSEEPTKAPVEPTTPATVSAEAAAEAEVLRLVNVERIQAGCTPLAANSGLSQLARAFSDDMAERGFFDHTDPDGATPWDRAEKAGITDLGGENIARGQADAAAVMQAWMNSPGHRANILNCDFKTLGVGVHYGDGGPWWTQDFGY